MDIRYFGYSDSSPFLNHTLVSGYPDGARRRNTYTTKQGFNPASPSLLTHPISHDSQEDVIFGRKLNICTEHSYQYNNPTVIWYANV